MSLPSQSFALLNFMLLIDYIPFSLIAVLDGGTPEASISSCPHIARIEQEAWE